MDREKKALEADKAVLQKTLDERSRTLKLAQRKVLYKTGHPEKLADGQNESRQALKDENASLKAEVERLRVSVAIAVSDRDRDLSPALFPNMSPHRSSSPTKRNSSTGDESLAIDMSQSAPESFLSSPVDAGPSRHPTARTIVCDVETDVFSRSHKRRRDDKAKASKYFRQSMSDDDEWSVFRPEWYPKNEDDTNVLVAGSSSPIPPFLSLPLTSPKPAPKRTNPFPNTKEESEKRKMLKIAPKDDSVVDMTQDTPERLQQRVPLKSLQNAQANRPLVATGSSSTKQKSAMGQTSIVDFVGLRDQQGRPKKGVVAGARVKRRV